MRKIFYLFTVAFSPLFANDMAESPEKSSQHANITYFRIGGSLIPIGEGTKFGPAFAFGERFERGIHAIDLSIAGGCFNKNSYFTFPKVMYLYYFNFDHSSSLYAGGGLSYGYIKNKASHKKFAGILAEAAVGYEWMRKTSIRTFVEMNISQGAIALSDKHHYMPPIVSVSFGVGF